MLKFYINSWLVFFKSCKAMLVAFKRHKYTVSWFDFLINTFNLGLKFLKYITPICLDLLKSVYASILKVSKPKLIKYSFTTVLLSTFALTLILNLGVTVKERIEEYKNIGVTIVETDIEDVSIQDRMYNSKAAMLPAEIIDTNNAENDLNITEPNQLINEESIKANQTNIIVSDVTASIIQDDITILDGVTTSENVADPLVTAYAIYIDDEYIGAMPDKQVIEETLTLLKLPYQKDGVTVKFNHAINFDTVEIPKSSLTSENEVLNKLLKTEDIEKVYEVKPSDCPETIANTLNIPVSDLYNLKATYNNKVVNLKETCLVGTQIYFSVTRKFLHVYSTKVETITDMLQYDSVSVDDSELYLDSYVIDTKGEYGEQTRECENTYDDDGKLIESVTISTTVSKRPVTEVIHRGTRQNIIPFSSDAYVGGMGLYVFPVGSEEAYVSDTFGGKRQHKGIDIAAPYGSPVYSVTSGTVVDVNVGGWGSGYGTYVLVENDDGYTCMYGHLCYTSDNLSIGTKLKAGQVLGYIGSTGDSTGNHLHFEVRYNNSFLNPANFVIAQE